MTKPTRKNENGGGSGELVCDRAEAERFLKLLDQEATEFSFQAYDDNKERKDPSLARVLHGTLAAHWAALVRLNERGAGIAVTISRTNLKGRTAKDVTGTRAQFVDLDGAPYEPLLGWSFQPHIIVETSPGKFHSYWLTDGVKLDDFTPIQQALAERTDGDQNVCDLPHAMRLPGFMHNKGTPRLVRIVHTHEGRRYQPHEFPKAVKPERKPPGSTVAEGYRVACALAVLPNEFDRHEWIRIGMAVHAATEGSELGRRIFDAWSRKWSGYNENDTATAWQSFRPEKIGAGTIFWRANQARPGWEDALDDDDPAIEAKIVAFCKEMGIDEGEEQQQGEQSTKDETEQQDTKDDGTSEDKKERATGLLQSSADFVAGFVPPDYLIDGLLQRRYLYSLTGPTGAGKTLVVLRIATHVALGLPLAGREIVKGRVLFLAGENPDDVRTRWIKLCEEMQQDPATMDVFFVPGTPDITDRDVRVQIRDEAIKYGDFSLVVIDTSAAYFKGDDENSNAQMAEHARTMRKFVNIPGGPTVIVTCHPTKNADLTNLVPRGGGAYLNEVDGNLVAIRQPGSTVVELDTHGKFRGPEFEPIPFKIVAGTSPKLKDTKGRLIWTVTATPITADERNELDETSDRRQDELLKAIQREPGRSMTELAVILDWQYKNGAPNKSLVQRLLKPLVDEKLIEKRGGRPVITRKGTKYLGETDDDMVG